MFTKKSGLVLLAITLAFSLGVTGFARAQAIPHEISFQGILRNDDGTLISDGSHQLKFSLATTATATSFIWWEAKTVQTLNGVFETHLGDTTPFGFDFDTDLWLQVEIANGAFYAPLGPRTQLTPSPSALYALKVPAGSITSTELAANAAVKSLNTLTGDVTLVGGTNVTITPNFNELVIDAAGGSGGDDGDWAISGWNLTHNTTGVVALGTSTPTQAIAGHAMLQVQASLYPALALDSTNPSFNRWLMFNNGSSGDLLFSHATGTGLGTAMMILDDTGKLGIGHTPEATLDIDGGGYMAYNTDHGDFQIGNDGNALQFGVDVTGTHAGRAKIRAVGTAPFLNLGVGDNNIMSIRDQYVDFSFADVKKARMWGGDSNDQGGQLFMYGMGTSASVELDGYGGGGGSVYVRTDSGNASASMAATSSGGQIYCRNSAGDITVTIDGQYSDGYGRVKTQVLEITGGADLSEQFTVSAAEQIKRLEPGLVVSIDPENPGELQVSRTAYDRKVAGVISGAGGVRTGMLMGQDGSVADGQHPVALTGRVYVQADASGGAIEPGDLLTSSAIPGHAMKVTDHDLANGAILGKAMTGLADGQGLVLVLVSLQ